jgi:hypothetical protein
LDLVKNVIKRSYAAVQDTKCQTSQAKQKIRFRGFWIISRATRGVHACLQLCSNMISIYRQPCLSISIFTLLWSRSLDEIFLNSVRVRPTDTAEDRRNHHFKALDRVGSTVGSCWLVDPQTRPVHRIHVVGIRKVWCRAYLPFRLFEISLPMP